MRSSQRASAIGATDDRGRIEPGLRADLVCLHEGEPPAQKTLVLPTELIVRQSG